MIDGLPFNLDNMMTQGGGQVRNAGGGRVMRILRAHGIERRLSSEGGRTSRGTPAKALAYAQFLNERVTGKPEMLPQIMDFWINRVRDYFASKPFLLHLDPALSVGAVIGELMAQVQQRQAETTGSTLVGTVVQHLVGAKVEVRLGLNAGLVAQHGASVKDDGRRTGDFEIGDCVIHVTTAPGQLLIEKCGANTRAGLRPIIVTGVNRLAVAKALIADMGHEGRIDVFDYEQFIATNVFELGRFDAAGRRDAFEAIIQRYNEIVTRVESDPGLRIELT